LSKPSRRAARAADRSTRTGGSFAGDPTSVRAGRRERARTGYYRRSFFSRYRNWIVGVGGIAAAAVLFGFLFLGATSKTYACSNLWDPKPTASPSAGATPEIGYLQPDMGRLHNATDKQRYTNCPPASGPHYAAQPGVTGPIEPRVYGPDDFTEPQGWIHNMEHGALVLLYKCTGDACTDEGQARFKAFYQTFPNSPICNVPKGQQVGPGPVIARFDDMKWPYAALVWDRVLPLQTFDTEQILAFYKQWGERNNPEPACSRASPSPGGSAAPSGSVAPSGSASGSAAPSASAEASASPS
jgi:hypothetical protein